VRQRVGYSGAFLCEAIRVLRLIAARHGETGSVGRGYAEGRAQRLTDRLWIDTD
jgi:hypothetical protein